MKSVRFIVAFVGFIQISAANALQFTADAVISAPGNVADTSSRLFYSQERMRKEFYYYGEPVIQILDASKQMSLMCFTEQRICYQNKSLEKINTGIESVDESPCDDDTSLQCELVGKEMLNDRDAIKWKITAQQGDQLLVSYLWLDSEYKIPVKQTLLDGSTVVLRWQASEMLGDRETEKWLQTITLSSGDKLESYQWYDKQLQISIRQTFPNGKSQELRNIKVEKLPDKLFTMPEGFIKKLVSK